MCKVSGSAGLPRCGALPSPRSRLRRRRKSPCRCRRSCPSAAAPAGTGICKDSVSTPRSNVHWKFALLEVERGVGSGLGTGLNHRAAQVCSPRAALRPVVGHHRRSGSGGQAQIAHQLQLRLRVRREPAEKRRVNLLCACSPVKQSYLLTATTAATPNLQMLRMWCARFAHPFCSGSNMTLSTCSGFSMRHHSALPPQGAAPPPCTRGPGACRRLHRALRRASSARARSPRSPRTARIDKHHSLLYVHRVRLVP
jgi:hypothetical protein